MTTFGVSPREVLKSMDGLTFLRQARDGILPIPPVMETLGFRLADIEYGRISCNMTPAFGHYNPMGTVHGGVIATLLDTCMGCAVHSTLPAGRGYTTLEIKINYVRATVMETGTVTAEGKIIHAGRQSATAEAVLRDADGRLLAHGTTTCLVFDI